jgi:hypothetical protein
MTQPPVMRNALEQMLAQFPGGKPNWALFTTFTFSSTFFEGNVLPLLAGMPLEDLKGSKVVQAELNEALRSVRTLVVCDRSANPQAKGDMRYGLLPVGLEAGRFHPKLMLLGGPSLTDPARQALWLTVSSGNLSLSGWAIQREVAGVTAVTRQQRDALLPLLHWLQEQARARAGLAGSDSARPEGDITQLLQDVATALADEASLAREQAGTPTLHLAWPPALARAQDQAAALLPALTGGEKWDRAVVVSPYWAGVEGLVSQLGVKACACMLVPAPAPDGRTLRPSGTSADRYQYGCFVDGAERASHAKAVLLSRAGDHVLCAGSANFTTAAWSHGDGILSNIEAMLRYRIRGDSPWQGLIANRDEPEDALQDADPDAEGAPPLPPFDAEAACDWLARKLVVRVRVHKGAALQAASIAIGESGARIDVRKIVPQDFTFPAKSLRTIKTFEVTYTLKSGTQAKFNGLVLQLDAPEDVLGYRPRPHLSNVLKLLRSLQPKQSPEEVTKRARREGASDEEDGVEDESTTPSLDLFAFFQATFQMRRYFASHRELDPFDPSSPFGPHVLYRAVALLQAGGDEALIVRYIQLAELVATVDTLPATAAAQAGRAELRKALLEDLKEPEVRVRALLRQSEAFARMFPRSNGSQRSDMLIAWFREQVGAAHGG